MVEKTKTLVLGSLSIPCTIKILKFSRALCDLRVSINLIPYANISHARVGETTTYHYKIINSRLDNKKPIGVLDDMLIRVDWFIFPVEFLILDYALDHENPIIIGRPILDTERELMDVECNRIKFLINHEEVFFSVCK